MRGVAKSRGGRILLGILLTLGFLAFIGWMLMRPKIGRATVSEIEAVLPPEAYAKQAVDEAAAKRMDGVIAISRLIGEAGLTKLKQQAMSNADKIGIAKYLWAGNEEQFDKLQKILDAGPLQYRPLAKPDGVRSYMIEMKQLVDSLALIGSNLAAAGDYDKGKYCTDLCLRLSNGVLKAKGNMMTIWSR